MPVDRTKRPFDPETGHGLRNWGDRATTDPDQLNSWLTAAPAGIGIGVVTGQPSRLVVVDVDNKDGKQGAENLRELEAIAGRLPATLMARTPSGGLHYFFKHPEHRQCRIPSPTNLGKAVLGRASHIDIRADGGQVNVAPTTREEGRYEWLSDPLTTQLADLPDAWLELILGNNRTSSSHSESVATIAEGGRNDTLFRHACTLRAKGVGEAGIVAELSVMNQSTCNPPLSEAEVETIARSAMRYEPSARYELNDSGNARRFADKFRHLCRYEVDSGRWRYWDGTCWRLDTTRELERWALMIPADIKREAEFILEARAKAAFMNWAKKSGDRARLAAMVNLAGADVAVACRSTDFDQTPGLLPVRNGVVDLRTGDISEHDPQLMITKAIPYEYRPEAESPRFKSFLNQVLPDEQLQKFVQRSLGYALHGRPVEQLFFLWQGRGANGKSVLADTVSRIIEPWVIKTPSSTFLSKDTDSATRTDLVRLQGSRLVFGGETPSRRKLDAVVVKDITGNRDLTARPLYVSEVTFPITFVPFMISNPLPAADEADDAVWRRLVLVPFDVTIAKEDRDPHLVETLIEQEAEGILAWLIEGAIDYHRCGLEVPVSCKDRTKVWRRNVGSIERFKNEDCEAVKGTQVPLFELHERYIFWCRSRGIHPLGIESFRQRLSGLEVDVVDSKDGELVIGLKHGRSKK